MLLMISDGDCVAEGGDGGSAKDGGTGGTGSPDAPEERGKVTLV